MRLHGNRLRSLSQWPTIGVLMVERNAITGNMVASDQVRGVSLLLLPGGSDPAGGGKPNAETAVTGNVFRGYPVLPPRFLPAPFDNWYVFNAIS
jgi:hypothetical protein